MHVSKKVLLSFLLIYRSIGSTLQAARENIEIRKQDIIITKQKRSTITSGNQG